jgi:hypothetical protein
VREWEWFRQGFDKLNHLLNPTASGWVGLSLRRVVGFGGRVRGGKPSTNETTNLRRMDDVQMGVASGWVGLSVWRVVGFGGRVCGGKPSTNEKHDDEWTMCKWESLRAGDGCPCGGFWISAGASVGEWMTNGWEADKRMDDSGSLNPLIR